MRSRTILLAAGALVALSCSAPERAAAPAPPETAPSATPPAAAEVPAPPDAPPAAPPTGTRHGRTVTADGRVFEAEYGGESQLPSNFPTDVPIYAAAQPMSSMSSAGHGTIVNLRTRVAPDLVFDWYKEQMPAAGWTIESEMNENGRGLLGLRKGNRVASLVITGAPDSTTILLSLRDDH